MTARVYTHSDVLQLDRTLQVRVQMRPERIEQFERLYLAGSGLPPISVFDTGERHEVLADGYHRVEAFIRLRGVRGAPTTIDYVRRRGSRVDAWLYALSANDAQSLSYTPDDRAAMVVRGWREYGLTYPEIQQQTPLLLTTDDQYTVAVTLRGKGTDLSYDKVAKVIGWSDGSTVQQRLARGYVGRRARPVGALPRRADDGAAARRLIDTLAGGSSSLAILELRTMGAEYVARRLVALRMAEAGDGDPRRATGRYRQRLHEQREYLAELVQALDELDSAMVAETGDLEPIPER